MEAWRLLAKDFDIFLGLEAAGDKGIMAWIRQVRPSQRPYIMRVLWRTQRMMKPTEYLKEHLTTRPAVTGGKELLTR